MSAAVTPSVRFRAARERAGLSVAETATRAGVSEPAVHDLESHEDELVMAYSAADLQRFARIFAVSPGELLGIEARYDPISAANLASAIRHHCHRRGVTLEEFGNAAGWDVSKGRDTAHVLLYDISIDGIRDVCRQLGIDWQRFIIGLADRR